MSGWFQSQIVHTGRLPLFCFFVAFLSGFAFIRLSVRLIRAGVRWWPGNIVRGKVHVHHMVFGVVFMGIGGTAQLAVPERSLAWHAAPAALFGLGMALVLDEFALILHLRDVYWSNEGRLSIDAVFVAAALTSLLLIGATPAGVHSMVVYHRLPRGAASPPVLAGAGAALFVLAAITLLKGKVWTGLFGLVVPLLLVIGALRLARPDSPWARWRYQQRPGKLAKAYWREQRLRVPVVRIKIRIVDLLLGAHDQPLLLDPPPAPAAIPPPGTLSGAALLPVPPVLPESAALPGPAVVSSPAVVSGPAVVPGPAFTGPAREVWSVAASPVTDIDHTLRHPGQGGIAKIG